MSKKTEFIRQQMFEAVAAISPVEGANKGDEHLVNCWITKLVDAKLEEFDQQDKPGDLLDQFIEHREGKTEKIAWEEEKKDEYRYSIYSIMKCMSLTLGGFPMDQQMGLVNRFTEFLFQECHTE